jgi:putative PIN family toxin of toxin-antitoxin system
VLKAVIDANVFISALLNPGSAADVIADLAHDKFELIYPARLIVELQRINDKPKLSTRISPEAVAEILELITEKGLLVEPTQVESICRDPSDDVYLACALAAEANFIVTGDHDLLSMSRHESTAIIMPATFLEKMRERGSD